MWHTKGSKRWKTGTNKATGGDRWQWARKKDSTLGTSCQLWPCARKLWTHNCNSSQSRDTQLYCNNRIKWRWSPKILTATHVVIYRRPQLNSYFFCVFLGIDAPLVPLRQSDMCLVCIAFASWVLKSASPQGADTWKAGMCFHCKYTCFKPQPHFMFILDVYWNLSVASKVI